MTQFHIGQSNLVSLSTNDRMRVLTDIRNFGFKKVRYEVPVHAWGFPWQPYSWTPVKHTALALEACGLGSLPVLGAHQPLFWKLTAKQYGQWCVDAMRTIYETTSHVPAQVEIWNEPNLINFWSKADPKTFYPFAQEAYDRIMAAYPDTEVILGGMAAAATGIQWPFIGGPKDPVSFVYAMTDSAKGKKFYDRLAYHPYNLTEGFQLAEPAPDVFGIKALGRMSALTPGQQVLITELGYQNKGEIKNAQDLAKHLTLIGQPDEVYLYCWRDADGERFGLVDTKNVPKQPYHDMVKGIAGI